MAFKDILVLVDRSPAAAGRIEVAARMASPFGAHVTGLHVTGPPVIPPSVTAEVAQAVLDAYAELHGEAAEKARSLFMAHVSRPGVAAEWRQSEGETSDVVAMHARCADLAVLGQDDPEAPAMDTPRGLVERVLLGSGRPVLVIPYIGARGAVGEEVAVAWNGTREATRAVNDALPLLRRARRVTVLTINARGGPEGRGDVPGPDIALHLARHDVRVEFKAIESEEVAVPEMLLSSVADLGADLLVMGGYGHSRLRELVMGGATRGILQAMTTPVFLSH